MSRICARENDITKYDLICDAERIVRAGKEFNAAIDSKFRMQVYPHTEANIRRTLQENEKTSEEKPMSALEKIVLDTLEYLETYGSIDREFEDKLDKWAKRRIKEKDKYEKSFKETRVKILEDIKQKRLSEKGGEKQ